MLVPQKRAATVVFTLALQRRDATGNYVALDHNENIGSDQWHKNSAGLRVFLSAHKNIAMKGGEFTVRNLSAQVKSVFDMTGFSKILNVV